MLASRVALAKRIGVPAKRAAASRASVSVTAAGRDLWFPTGALAGFVK